MAKIDDSEMERMVNLVNIQIALNKQLEVLENVMNSSSTLGEEGRQLSLNLSDAIGSVEEALESVERCMGWR
jgi:hypothetical protein